MNVTLCILESWYNIHAFMVGPSDDEKRWWKWYHSETYEFVRPSGPLCTVLVLVQQCEPEKFSSMQEHEETPHNKFETPKHHKKFMLLREQHLYILCMQQSRVQ